MIPRYSLPFSSMPIFSCKSFNFSWDCLCFLGEGEGKGLRKRKEREERKIKEKVEEGRGGKNYLLNCS